MRVHAVAWVIDDQTFKRVPILPLSTLLYWQSRDAQDNSCQKSNRPKSVDMRVSAELDAGVGEVTYIESNMQVPFVVPKYARIPDTP